MVELCDNISTIQRLIKFPIHPPCPPPFVTYTRFYEHAKAQGLQQCDVRNIATLCKLQESDIDDSESDADESTFWTSWQCYLIITSAVLFILIVAFITYRRFCRPKEKDENPLCERSRSDGHSNEGYEHSPNREGATENNFECKTSGKTDVKCHTEILSEKL
ncbi:hypothetical protein ACF0H5_003569 [Mactra antiquata]